MRDPAIVAALAGLVAVGIAQGWLGIIPGNWGINAAVLGLILLAVPDRRALRWPRPSVQL